MAEDADSARRYLNAGVHGTTHPVLAEGDIEQLRARLSRRLSRLVRNGERDVWRLANGAIFELRRELTAA